MSEENDRPFGRSEESTVLGVLASGRLWRGNGVSWGSQHDLTVGVAADRLEDSFGQWLGLPYVHAVNSGTSANEAAIVSLGLEPGDEVVCPAACPAFVPFAVFAAGCIPVFADVDPKTLLLDPDDEANSDQRNNEAMKISRDWPLDLSFRHLLG